MGRSIAIDAGHGDGADLALAGGRCLPTPHRVAVCLARDSGVTKAKKFMDALSKLCEAMQGDPDQIEAAVAAALVEAKSCEGLDIVNQGGDDMVATTWPILQESILLHLAGAELHDAGSAEVKLMGALSAWMPEQMRNHYQCVLEIVELQKALRSLRSEALDLSTPLKKSGPQCQRIAACLGALRRAQNAAISLWRPTGRAKHRRKI